MNARRSSLAQPARAGRAPRPRAFTLIECLVYMAVLALILGVAFAAFYRCWDNALAMRRDTGDIERALAAGERWRADLRAATASPRVDDTNGRQILSIPGARGEVAYAFSDGRVQRRAAGSPTWVVVLPNVKTSRMQADPRQFVRPWRWDLELTAQRKDPHLRPLFSFEAVVGSQGKP